jgi:Ca2+-binding EF-hand superfamily protein
MPKLIAILMLCATAWSLQAQADTMVARANEPLLTEDEREQLRGDLDQYSSELHDREKLEKHRQLLRDRAKQRFKEADKSGNGRLDRQEFSREYPNVARYFNWIDSDGDGEVSQIEIAKALRARIELRRKYLERKFRQ